MEYPTEYVPKPTNSYLVSWFRDPFSLLATMFCRLYGLSNCSMFKAEWVPRADHILLIGESFNWEEILSVNLKEEIEKYQKTPTTRKPTFYISGYVMDVFCATSAFPALGWNWNKNSPSVHI